MARKLVRWEPMREMFPMQDYMDRAFGDWFWNPLAAFGMDTDGTLAVDMYESNGNLVVKTAMPGVKPDDIDVSVTGDTLNIKAKTREEEEVREENYLRHERRFGSYRRSIHLPGGVKTDKVEADYGDGILTLTFPKTEEAKTKSIRVKAK